MNFIDKQMIKWGIIAPGTIANAFAKEVTEAQGVLTAVYGRNEEKARNFANKYNIEKYYSDIDEFLNDKNVEAVYIATPHNYHVEFVEKCIENNKHVLCEKPFSYNKETTERVLNLAKGKNIFVMEALWTMFLPSIKKVKEWIETGKIGKVKLITANLGFKSTEDLEGRLYNPMLAGGALLDVGIYTILIANYLNSDVPENINALAEMTKSGVDETDIINLKYRNGELASLSCSIVADTENTAVIYGEKGKIIIPYFWMAKKAILEAEEKEVFEDTYMGTGYKYEILEAMECIKSNKLESDVASHKFTLELAEIMDEIRGQIGLIYPFEK